MINSMSASQVMCHCTASVIYLLPHILYIYIWVILLKTGQNRDTEGKNSKCEFFILLFGNESLTSLVYRNIRHKLIG